MVGSMSQNGMEVEMREIACMGFERKATHDGNSRRFATGWSKAGKVGFFVVFSLNTPEEICTRI